MSIAKPGKDRTFRLPSYRPVMNKKLSMTTIQKVRRLYKTGKYKQAFLAATYGVISAQISRLVNSNQQTRQFETTDD